MDKTVFYDVTGMACAGCQAHVDKAVRAVEGVADVEVSLLTKSMRVTGTASPEAVIAAVRAAGFGAALKAETPLAEEDPFADHETPRLLKRFLGSLVLLVGLMALTMGHSMFGMPLPGFLTASPVLFAGVEGILALLILAVNRSIFVSGLRALGHGAPNMDTLIALGSGIAFVWSVFELGCLAASPADAETLWGMVHERLYFETAAMVPVLITLGKTLESLSKGRTTNALKSLVKLSPKTATIVRDGEETKVAVSAVAVGDEIVVRPGDSIPVDGTVLTGATTVDEATLTGEAAPVEKGAGDKVHAATMNLTGLVHVRADRVGEDTTFSQIVKLVTEASASKAPIARMADTVSGVFVPVILAVSALTAVVYLALGAETPAALERGIAVLVVACPCALGLATPVAIMVACGVGARNGLLFKTGAALEQAGRVRIVALDKTGTLTEGRPDAPNALKPDAVAAVKELKHLGLKTVLLSGDTAERAQAVGADVGTDRVIAGVLPGGKGDVIRTLRAEGKIAMVGDGVNDAPALTEADVGIAIGAGTDVAIESASVVLVHSRVSDVVSAILLGRATLRNVRENLFWAFAYNVLLIPAAAGLYPGFAMKPVWGAAAMALSSVTVCLNALRLNRFRPFRAA